MLTLMDMVYSLLDAVRISPETMDGVSCSGSSPHGKKFSYSLGNTQTGPISGMRYPSITMNRLRFETDDGHVTARNLTLKPIDFSGVVRVIRQGGDTIDDAWLKAHSRQLVPQFSGVSLSGLDIDVPEVKNPGQRLKMSIGGLDLSLSDYVHGIPTDIVSSGRHLAMELPQTTPNVGLQKLLALGVKRLDFGYDLSTRWDKAKKEIEIHKFGVREADMGSASLSALIGNATDDLFSDNANAMRIAGLTLTVKKVGVEITNGGLEKMLLTSFASRKGTTVEALRTKASGLAQAAILGLLGGSSDASRLASEVGAFIDGGKHLSATFTAKRPSGLNFGDLAVLKSDPTSLGGKVTVKSSEN